MSFDLLTTVEYGGCSAKLPPGQLAAALADLPVVDHPNLLVDIETHDDAGVYRISDEVALVQTTDFFTPICSDPYEFGKIAAANALSDVYAMGGIPITALNLVLFPSSRIPLEVLKEILHGGQDMVAQAGAVIVGGHTIDDYPPKYGLAVTGTVHPDKIITNSGALPGDRLILTKPVGMGVLVAGARIGEAEEFHYRKALEYMMQLNKEGGEVMRKSGVRCATDVTGFSLLGHALKMARASGVTIRIDGRRVPLLDGAYDLVDLGCIPGACFRNQSFVENDTCFFSSLDYNIRMILLDAQTSGGLLMCVPPEKTDRVLDALRESGHQHANEIGIVAERTDVELEVV